MPQLSMASSSGAPAPARRSSTSSSKRRLYSWALCGGILMLVEALRRLPSGRTLFSIDLIALPPNYVLEYKMRGFWI